jgi:hypothetical protein
MQTLSNPLVFKNKNEKSKEKKLKGYICFITLESLKYVQFKVNAFEFK